MKTFLKIFGVSNILFAFIVFARFLYASQEVSILNHYSNVTEYETNFTTIFIGLMAFMFFITLGIICFAFEQIITNQESYFKLSMDMQLKSSN